MFRKSATVKGLTAVSIGVAMFAQGLNCQDLPQLAFTTPTGTSQCDALIAAGLGDKLLLPGDGQYQSRISSWWSLSSRLTPWCIVQPRSAEDVSTALKALAGVDHGYFAIRSGGHSHWTGGSNIKNGVTIDLGYFNKTTYDPVKKLASLGPAQRWGDVFTSLEKYGVIVPGGRDGGVGVAGLLTGGGNSYYTGRHGFVCDNLINAEVVLADGSIVNANATSYPDLWKALKGGWGNFGIVTRFDLPTIDAGKLWGGLRVSTWNYSAEVTETLIKFTDNNYQYPQDAYIINFTYQPAISPDLIAAQVVIDTDGVPNPPAFEEIQQIPQFYEDIHKRTMSNVANTYALPAGLRNVWFTLTFKNDARVVNKSAELIETFTKDMLKIVPPKDLVTQSLWQPVPKIFADIGVEKGGNVLGLEQADGNTLLWLCATSVTAAEHEPILHRKASAMTAELWNYGESINATSPWVYINYADPSQNPLKSYGTTNIAFMKGVSAKYDPTGLFQKMQPGMFTLDRIDTRTS